MERRDGSSVKIINAELRKTSAWKTYDTDEEIRFQNINADNFKRCDIDIVLPSHFHDIYFYIYKYIHFPWIIRIVCICMCVNRISDKEKQLFWNLK